MLWVWDYLDVADWRERYGVSFTLGVLLRGFLRSRAAVGLSKIPMVIYCWDERCVVSVLGLYKGTHSESKMPFLRVWGNLFCVVMSGLLFTAGRVLVCLARLIVLIGGCVCVLTGSQDGARGCVRVFPLLGYGVTGFKK